MTRDSAGRSTLLAAAYLAAAARKPISRVHCEQAIRRELAKNGRIVDGSRFDALK